MTVWPQASHAFLHPCPWWSPLPYWRGLAIWLNLAKGTSEHTIQAEAWKALVHWGLSLNTPIPYKEAQAVFPETYELQAAASTQCHKREAISEPPAPVGSLDDHGFLHGPADTYRRTTQLTPAQRADPRSWANWIAVFSLGPETSVFAWVETGKPGPADCLPIRYSCS